MAILVLSAMINVKFMETFPPPWTCVEIISEWDWDDTLALVVAD